MCHVTLVTVTQIKMPPKMLRRGRPKGAEATVIGLPRKERSRRHGEEEA